MLVRAVLILLYLVLYLVIAVHEFGLGFIISTEHVTNACHLKATDTHANDKTDRLLRKFRTATRKQPPIPSRSNVYS